MLPEGNHPMIPAKTVTSVSPEASIVYNSSFMRAGTTRDAFRDNYILYVKRGIQNGKKVKHEHISAARNMKSSYAL